MPEGFLQSVAAGSALAVLLASAIPALGQEGGVDELCRAVIASPAPDGDANVLVLKADCALALGQANEAAQFYAAALAVDPSNLTTRAELAGLLLLLGRGNEATPLLAAASTSNPGDPAAHQTSSLADSFPETPAPGGWSGSIALGRGYDSNVSGGTFSSTFDAIIAGTLLELTIAEASKGQPDWASQLSGSARYLHVLDANNAVVLSGNAGLTVYDQHSRYNRLDTSIGVGLLHGENNLTWSLTPNARLVWEDAALDRAGFYFDGRIQLGLTAQTALIGFGKVGYSLAGQDAALNHASGQVGIGLEHEFDERLSARVALAVERKASNTPTQSIVQFGPSAGLHALLSDSLALDLAYRYDLSLYDQTMAFFPQARQDSEHELSAALTLDLSSWTEGLSAEARYRFEYVDSTLDLYDRDQHVIATSLRYEF